MSELASLALLVMAAPFLLMVLYGLVRIGLRR